MVLLLGPLGLELLLVGLTILVDSVMWKKLVWPEFEVLWFNSVLNRSTEWGVSFSYRTHSFHWYFTSALPRSLLAAYPLFVLGVVLDRRVLSFVIPVFSFVLLYSKLPHKELRFIISSVPIFNLSAAVAANRIYMNRKKSFWKFINIILLGFLLISLGCTVITFMASYENYPSGNALQYLHRFANNELKVVAGNYANNTEEQWVHIDPFSAMNGISRFCENDFPWRYSKEEGIPLKELFKRNFTYLINEHSAVDGYKCLFTIDGFSRIHLQTHFPPVILVKEPKVYIHGNMENKYLMHKNWPGCP
ncbi:hypothetical protein Q3G72_005773 [Acer saccharum]|nr:hypothetical protein Q3G72_005773 [Acer saccharum]